MIRYTTGLNFGKSLIKPSPIAKRPKTLIKGVDVVVAKMNSPHTRTLIFVLVFSLLLGMVSAVEIQAPPKAVSYAPLTFQVTLPDTDKFTQSAVHFDNLLVATIYPSGACAVQPDWIPFIIHCATFDADTKTAGLPRLYHTGFTGRHILFRRGSAAKTVIRSIFAPSTGVAARVGGWGSLRVGSLKHKAQPAKNLHEQRHI